jgi:hypothetical protein
MAEQHNWQASLRWHLLGSLWRPHRAFCSWQGRKKPHKSRMRTAGRLAASRGLLAPRPVSGHRSVSPICFGPHPEWPLLCRAHHLTLSMCSTPRHFPCTPLTATAAELKASRTLPYHGPGTAVPRPVWPVAWSWWMNPPAMLSLQHHQTLKKRDHWMVEAATKADQQLGHATCWTNISTQSLQTDGCCTPGDVQTSTDSSQGLPTAQQRVP